jgi:hypothetical protein
MDAFSYLSVLLSIILGLGITQVLQGYRALLLSRSRVRLYAPTIIWSGLLLTFSAQLWWASFGLANHHEWNFGTFAIILLQTVLLYMMSALVLPDIPVDRDLDLKEHYFREASPFFIIGLMMIAVSISKDCLLDGKLPSTANLAFHGLFAAMATTALLARRSRIHELLAVLMVLFIITYIALLFERLGQG